MKNQFLSLTIIFLMGYFSGNLVKEIRPIAFSMYNTIEALVVSNNSNKVIAKDLPKEHKNLVMDNQFALIDFDNYFYFNSKSELIHNNSLNEELLYNTERLFTYVTSKLATSRGSPRHLFNNTS